MELNDQKELFSKAYVHAVAAVAGYATYEPYPDRESVDLGIAAVGGSGTYRSPRLELQLKCTSPESLEQSWLTYPLKRKNYDELIATNLQVPRILVVVAVPGDVVEDWLLHSEEHMFLRRCAYWHSLRGMPETTNDYAVSIRIPRKNFFSPDELRQLMSLVAARGYV